MIDVFEYSNYKVFLADYIGSLPSKGRGVRLALSQFLGCQTAYISQVINKDSHFSLEQSVKVAKFVGLGKEETKFFLLLVQLARAGSVELEGFLKAEKAEILEKRKDLQNRHQIKESLDELNQNIYYSSWYYAAIHVILSIPGFDNPKSIADYFHLQTSHVQEVLNFLVETGLAVFNNHKYEIGKTRIHLGRDSIQIKSHHSNWRSKAIDSININSIDNLHYSSVVTISRTDVEKIKQILSKALDATKEVIRPSVEEEVHAINLDFFKL